MTVNITGTNKSTNKLLELYHPQIKLTQVFKDCDFAFEVPEHLIEEIGQACRELDLTFTVITVKDK